MKCVHADKVTISINTNKPSSVLLIGTIVPQCNVSFSLHADLFESTPLLLFVHPSSVNTVRNLQILHMYKILLFSTDSWMMSFPLPLSGVSQSITIHMK